MRWLMVFRQSYKFGLLALLLLVFVVPAKACSLAACINNGIELNRTFSVVVTHDGKALHGVSVRVTGADSKLISSGVTAQNGSFSIANLSAGDYWLSADFLGIGAAYECFHVTSRPSRHAKGKMSYEWGTLATATRHIAGKLIDSRNGNGGTPIWNLLHRENVPIAQAKLRLENPLNRQKYYAVSDQSGAYAFSEVVPGTYALHVEGGGSGGSYDATDMLVRLSPSANKTALNLIRREGGGGSCGGTSLELSD